MIHTSHRKSNLLFLFALLFHLRSASSNTLSCPPGYTGLKPTDECKKFYHCVGGTVTGNPIPCPAGTLFHTQLQVCNWANAVQCELKQESMAPTSSSTTENPSQSPSESRIGPPRAFDEKIIGYYASWQWYDRNYKAKPENMDFTKVGRVNFAFFQTDVSGNLFGTDSWGDPQVLFGPYDYSSPNSGIQYCSWDQALVKNCNYHQSEKGLINLVHDAGAEIYPSIGGWTLSDTFPAMAASPSARSNFADQCVDLIKEYGFDGIDIDWEYPGYTEHSGTANDRANFNLLLQVVRGKLDVYGGTTGRYYGLTAALPCGPSHINNIDIATVSTHLDELNLMSYDLNGAWNSVTGMNAPLYHQGWGATNFNVDSCVNTWKDAGAANSKINIGLPFYGRSFSQATLPNQSHSGPDNYNWSEDDGLPQYYNIEAKMSQMSSVRHEPSKTQYASFNNGSGFLSYDDTRSICDKTEYVLDNNLNGFIIWELSGDVMNDLSTPLLDMVNSKLENPSLSCASPSEIPSLSPSQIPSNSPSEVPSLSPSQVLSNSPSEIPSLSPSQIPSNSPSEIPSLAPDPLCANVINGLVAAEDCKSFQICVNGNISTKPISCPQGTLFDTDKQFCNWDFLVNCDSNIDLSGYFNVYSMNSRSKCLAPAKNILRYGQNIRLTKCKKYDAHQWKVDFEGKISSKANSKMCIGRKKNGLVLQKCKSGNKTQKFYYSLYGSRLLLFENGLKGLAAGSGSSVIISNQLSPRRQSDSWNFFSVKEKISVPTSSSGKFFIVSTFGNGKPKCLMAKKSTNKIFFQTCKKSQMFEWILDRNGVFRHNKLKKCIEIKNSAALQLSSCSAVVQEYDTIAYSIFDKKIFSLHDPSKILTVEKKNKKPFLTTTTSPDAQSWILKRI